MFIMKKKPTTFSEMEGLSCQLYNILNRRIGSVDRLINMTEKEVLMIRGIGSTRMVELKEIMKKYNMTFKKEEE